jgi:hypothetical protein
MDAFPEAVKAVEVAHVFEDGWPTARATWGGHKYAVKMCASLAPGETRTPHQIAETRLRTRLGYDMGLSGFVKIQCGFVFVDPTLRN